MIFFPAIDLKDGKCVRLKQGDMLKSTVFDLDPVARAQSFNEAGCSWLHLVDLNGALEGKPVNHKIVESIIKNVDINIQLGGGIRDFNTIDFWINAGIKRLIIGTMALKKPELVKEACEKYPGKIAIGIDVRDGKMATEGWVEQSKISALDFVKKFEDVNVAAIIYTDISRDGVLMGPAIEETLNFAANTNIPIIISGGVSSIEDIREIKKKAKKGIIGVISGRAIYDKRLNVSECNNILGN